MLDLNTVELVDVVEVDIVEVDVVNLSDVGDRANGSVNQKCWVDVCVAHRFLHPPHAASDEGELPY